MAIFSSFVAAADARVRSRRPRRAAQITRAHVRRYKPRRRKVIPFLEKLAQLLQEEPDVEEPDVTYAGGFPEDYSDVFGAPAAALPAF